MSIIGWLVLGLIAGFIACGTGNTDFVVMSKDNPRPW
jgi:uncharacterized membrane protein YeaQ/YmgE (transglycosylase-associated protein family)